MWPASLVTPEIRVEFRRLLAMETAALRLIETALADLPKALHATVMAHRDQTAWQADLLQTCVEMLDAENMASPSVFLRDAKAWGGGLAALQAQNTFEVSNYQSALVIARRVHIPEISEICEELLDVEKAFCRWLHIQRETHAWSGLPNAAPQAARWAVANGLQGWQG